MFLNDYSNQGVTFDVTENKQDDLIFRLLKKLVSSSCDFTLSGRVGDWEFLLSLMLLVTEDVFVVELSEVCFGFTVLRVTVGFLFSVSLQTQISTQLPNLSHSRLLPCNQHSFFFSSFFSPLFFSLSLTLPKSCLLCVYLDQSISFRSTIFSLLLPHLVFLFLLFWFFFLGCSITDFSEISQRCFCSFCFLF